MNILLNLRQRMPFLDIPILGQALSLADLVLALVLALIIYITISIIKQIILSKRAKRQNSSKLTKALKDCFAYFPETELSFNGEVYTRGMIIKITTSNKKVLEGILLGINLDNIYCILTRTSVETESLINIREINIIKNPYKEMRK